MSVGRVFIAALLALGLIAPAFAAEVPVTATKIETFKGMNVGERVDGLVWRGGLVLNSEVPEFGGLSGITFTGPGKKLTMVSDKGNFVAGHLIYDEMGRPLGLGNVTITAINNSKGVELPRAFARDAEAIDLIIREGEPAAVRVGFENLTRVADFELKDGVPEGAAREISIPTWMENLRTNSSLEAVCIAPLASPVAGSTLLITEGKRTASGYAAYMLGVKDRGELSLTRTPGLNPTDCAFLPNGDLLVLERSAGLLGFSMQLRCIKAEDVMPGSVMDGEVLLKASGGDIDNMEGLAVHEGPNGETRITIISDDNFNDWERSLLLEFTLPN